MNPELFDNYFDVGEMWGDYHSYNDRFSRYMSNQFRYKPRERITMESLIDKEEDPVVREALINKLEELDAYYTGEILSIEENAKKCAYLKFKNDLEFERKRNDELEEENRKNKELIKTRLNDYIRETQMVWRKGRTEVDYECHFTKFRHVWK